MTYPCRKCNRDMGYHGYLLANDGICRPCSTPNYSPTHPGRKPQGGVWAYLKGHGRVWVESIASLHGTALVRFDANTGFRSRVKKVQLAEIDFEREWRFQ